MGFFLKDGQHLSNAKPERARGTRTAKAPKQLNPNQVGCDYCSLRSRWPSILTPKMKLYSEGRKPDILVLGEAPSADEDQKGRPFVGRLLRDCIPGRKMERIAWLNAARCWPEDNRTPSLQELHACGTYLEADVMAMKPKAILGVGGVPLLRYRTSKEATITDLHGIRFPVAFGDHVCWYYPVLHPNYLHKMGGEDSPAYPVFQNDLSRFFSTVDSWPKPQIYNLKPSDVICSHDEAEVRAIVDQLQEPIAVDIETPGLRPFQHSGRILTAAFSDGYNTIAFPIAHKEAPNEWGLKILMEVIQRKHWIAHNAAFELLWTWFNLGGPDNWVPGAFEDTMALARIYHQRHNVLSLAELSLIHLGQDVKRLSSIDTRKVEEYPLSVVLPYNGLDALATILIYWQLHDKADKWQVKKILGSIKSTVGMELKGLPVDIDSVKQLHDRFDGIRQKAEQEAKQLYEVRQFELKYQIPFNIGSGENIGVALEEFGKVKLPKTAKKQIAQTDEAALEAIDSPLAKLVLDHREAGKLCSTYLEGVLNGGLLGQDGLLHPAYTTMFTRTLRLSSEYPNIQNFPKRKHREIRAYIAAPKGYILVAIDYGQLEARVIAMASKDRWLCEAILTGYDVHADWRDKLLKLYPEFMYTVEDRSGEKKEDKLLKSARDIVKNQFVFASFFGSGAQSCSNNMQVPLRIIQELSEEFWARFSGVKKWLKARRIEYRSTGAVRTLTGRPRYGIMMGNEPINNPIQGTAADIVQESQNELFDLALTERNPIIMPRINVHDDLTFLMPDDDRLEEYIRTVGMVMVKRRFDFQIVPLVAEVSVGYDWANLQEITKFTGDYYQ